MILSPSASSRRSTLIPLQNVPFVEPEILDDHLVAVAHEGAVLARDPFVVQPHGDLGAAADDRPVLLQLEHLARAHPGQHDQVGEVSLLLLVRLDGNRGLGRGLVLSGPRGLGARPRIAAIVTRRPFAAPQPLRGVRPSSSAAVRGGRCRGRSASAPQPDRRPRRGGGCAEPLPCAAAGGGAAGGAPPPASTGWAHARPAPPSARSTEAGQERRRPGAAASGISRSVDHDAPPVVQRGGDDLRGLHRPHQGARDDEREADTPPGEARPTRRASARPAPSARATRRRARRRPPHRGESA